MVGEFKYILTLLWHSPNISRRGAAPQWSKGHIFKSNLLTYYRKLFLYSVHDTTLMPCLMALGVFDMKWPPYAADITLELYQHRQTNQHYVKVSYIGQVRFTWESLHGRGIGHLKMSVKAVVFSSMAVCGRISMYRDLLPFYFIM